MKLGPQIALYLLLSLLCVGCTSIGKKTPGSANTFVYDSSNLPAEDEMPQFHVITDPYEPMNRVVWDFNEGCFRWVLLPINRAYAYVVPESARTCIMNLQVNLAYPVRLVNTALQGKFKGSLDETNRFLINTTVGVLGLFDPATSWWSIPAHREDFGQTFGFYGSRPGFYYVIPLLGPSSWRDVVGRVLDLPFDLSAWLTGARPFFGNNDLSFNVETYAQLMESKYDTYDLARILWALDREKDVRDYVVQADVSDPEPSLKSVFLAPTDNKFFRSGEDREVQVPTTGVKLPYNLWLQEEPAPLLLILPGLGSHRVSNGVVALAEMAYRNGYSAVTISSAMNWEFMEAASSLAIPGYTPADALDIVRALQAICDDIAVEHPNHVRRKALMGYSMGAVHTLHIAALESQGKLASFNIDRYLAINPPVSITHALSRLDDYYKAPLQWPPAQRRYGIENALLKTVTLAQGGLNPSEPVPLSRPESEFLIGLLFRQTLRDMLFSSQKRNNLGILRSDLSKLGRGAAYSEIDRYSYANYMERFALPYFIRKYQDRYTPEEIRRHTGLESIDKELKANKKIRVQINDNDFLLRPGDPAWLEAVLGDRLVRFSGGGHLGNLHLPAVQDQILQSLGDLR